MERKPYLNDADFTLWNGDVTAVLRELPADSVDCCITSPPYWGLRDYGTGEWEGGDQDCDHTGVARRCDTPGRNDKQSTQKGSSSDRVSNTCLLCGARRVDQQLGLESTPDEYVARMVELFREVRRVLAPHGTCWVNLGDSYASSPPGNTTKGVSAKSTLHGVNDASGKYRDTLSQSVQTRRNTVVGDLKPKDLVGIPWRVAFALQADGWYLRSDIIWAKPNPMPESVTDRPTKAHEYVFLLSKQPRYWFDQEAVRENYEGDPEYRYGRVGAYQNRAINGLGDGTTPTSLRGPDGRMKTTVKASDGSIQHRDGERWPNSGRNVRSVWDIATQPYPEAHFATYPEELVRRCLLAGCPERVCRTCGKPSERIVDSTRVDTNGAIVTGAFATGAGKSASAGPRPSVVTHTLGWSDCGHNDYRAGVVLDPFLGSGTTALVARKHGRHAVGIELNPAYCALVAKRLQQLSLFAEAG